MGGGADHQAGLDEAAERWVERLLGHPEKPEELVDRDPRIFGLEAVDEVARADQFIVAVGHREAFAAVAAALPAGQRRVGQRAAVVEGRLAVGVDTVGVGQVLRPDDAIDDADHHALAGAFLAAELAPQAVRAVQAEKLGV